MKERIPNIVDSDLSGIVSKDDITVEMFIYRLENEPKWSLEVVNRAGPGNLHRTISGISA